MTEWWDVGGVGRTGLRVSTKASNGADIYGMHNIRVYYVTYKEAKMIEKRISATGIRKLWWNGLG